MPSGRKRAEGGPRTPPRPGDTVRAAVLFAAATILLSYPLAFHPSSLSRLDNGDARLNAWAVSWVAHQAIQNPLELFHANTFHPLPHSLAYSEHLGFLGILALPLLAITDDLVLTNNLLLLLAMFASALAMYVLVRRLTGNHLAALLAGLFFSFAPFRFDRLPHLQMQLYAFLPLILSCLHAYLDDRRPRWLALMGAAFVLQALSGTYLGALAAVALGVALACLLPFAAPSRRDLARIGAALAVSALVLVPFVLPYLWVHRELGVEWGLEGLASLSATLGSYLSSNSHLYRSLSESIVAPAERRDFLFPGASLLVLGVLGAVVALRKRESRPVVLAYASILVAGVVLSLGPSTPVYPFLYEHVVFFRGLRALTRFGLLPLFSLSVLAGFALAWLFEPRRGLGHPRWAAAAVAAFFVAESTAAPYRLEPFEDEPPEVYRWLAEQPPGPMVELPFKVVDTRYMFWARHHDFRPMLNGDSGFVPMSHQWMKIALGRFPSADSIDLLEQLRVRYVVLHLGAFRQPALLRMLTRLEAYRHALVPVRDFGRDLVFEVASANRPLGNRDGEESFGATRERAPGAPVPAAGEPPELFDLDVRSPWRPLDRDAKETTLEVSLDRVREIGGVRLHYGAAPRVPADGVDVWVENEDGGLERFYSTPPDWPAVSELILGLLESPLDGTQTLRLPAVRTRRLRIRLRGMDGEAPELTEVAILGLAAAVSRDLREPSAGRAGPRPRLRVPGENGESKDGLEAHPLVEGEGPLVAGADHE